MRLLWLKSNYVIPPDTGGTIRTYNLMRELHQLCDLTYVAFKESDTPNDEPEIAECASHVRTVYQPTENKSGLGFYLRVMRGMKSKLPYVIQKYRHPCFADHQKKFYEESPKDAIVLCDFLNMAENVDWSLPCPKVLFQHNVETMIWDRLYETEKHPLKKAYFNFERKRMAKYEADISNRFDFVFAVSEEDKIKFQREFGVKTPIKVLPTGVDTHFFKPTPHPATIPGRLVFLGSMDWMPNIDAMKWFVAEVYDLIKAKSPHASLDIVGRRPGEEIHRLAKNNESIRVVPDVPDVRPYIDACDLFIVPIRVGGGTRIKIYEGMAMNRPVVSTTIGAEGLPLTPDQHIAIGDTPKEFAEQVIGLLSDPVKKQRISEAGYRLVTENYQWKNVATSLRDHCRELMNS